MLELLSKILLAIQSPNWPSRDTWKCLNHILDSYYSDEHILLLSNFNIALSSFNNRSIYIATNTIPPKHHTYVNLMIFEELSSWQGDEVQGKVILVVKSISSIENLWVQFKIVDIVVVVQTNSGCNLYTWFPYDRSKCYEPISLELIDRYENDTFLYNRNLFPPKFSGDLGSCPLKTVFCPCGPFVQLQPSGKLGGPMVDIIEDLLEASNAKRTNYPVTDFYGFFSLYVNGTFSGAFAMLKKRQVDLAASCLSTSYYGSDYFELLPSESSDGLVWLLPPPIPQSHLHGYYSCFTKDAWLAIILVSLATTGICKISLPKKAFAWGFLWTISRLLGVTFQPQNSNEVLNIYSIIYEWCALILTTLYKSSILVNIFFTPMEFYKDPLDAVKHGLTTMLRIIYMHLYNHTNHELWNIILSPNRHRKVILFDSEAITNRSAIGLIVKHVDELIIRRENPNVPLEDLVYEYPEMFQKVHHAIFMPPRHPYAPILTQRMSHLLAGGFNLLYMNRVYYTTAKAKPGSETKRAPIKWVQVEPIFWLLGIGLCAGLVAYLVEIAWKRSGSKRFESR